MPKGKLLSDKDRQQIYTRYVMCGEKQRDIAEDFGINISTVSRIVNEQRKAGEKRANMASHEKVVAGDKVNGRLLSTSDPHRFEGTCVVNGKRHSRSFVSVNARKATEMWEKWCQEQRDAQQFMDMVDRKPKDGYEGDHDAEPVAACGDPIEEIKPSPVPDIRVVPWREEAERRQIKINALNDRVAELESEVKRLTSELEEAKTQRIEFAEGYQIETHNPSYLLWAKGAETRAYGLYLDEDQALAEVDRLNEVASFLGSEGAFEVDEVQWR